MTPRIGTSLPTWELDPVPAGPMKVMALVLRDPNPIHYDTEALGRLGLPPRPINQGPNNVGYVINLLLRWADDPEALEAIRVRFRGNVLAGDRVVAGGQVTDVRDDGDDQLVDCEVWLDRGEDRVLDGTARVRLRSATP